MSFVHPETTNARALPRTRVVVIVVVAVAVGPPRWALRHDHRWGGAVGSALVRMLLDDTTAASASAPDSGGTQAIISIPCRRRHCIRACGLSTTPSFGRGGPTGGNNGVGEMTRRRRQRRPRLYIDLTFPAAAVIALERAVSRRLSRRGGRGGLPSCYRRRQLTREPATLGWST